MTEYGIPRSIYGEDHQMFREAARKFFEREVAPHHAKWEEDGVVPKEVWRKAGEAGFLCATMPEEYGGAGMNISQYVGFIRELAYASPAYRSIVSINIGMVCKSLIGFGTEQQKAHWLPKLAAGSIAAFGLTEPDSGSDSAEQQAPQQTPSSSAPTSSELANKEAELRAARESAGAARTGVRSCFDSLGTCMGDGGAPDQACLDKLKGCLPVAPPAPIGCPKLPEPTADDIAAVDDAVGAADDLAGEVLDFAGEVEEAVGPVIDDLAGQVEDAVNQILDGGIPLPPAPGAGTPGHGGRNKSGGARAPTAASS